MATNRDYTKGIWFGAAPEPDQVNKLLSERSCATAGIERAAIAVELFKLGKFQHKQDVLDAMDGADTQVRNGLCRVYCSVATHNEIASLLAILDENDEEDVGAFAAYSYLTLSIKSISHLLSLAEVWEGTDLEERLIDACRMLYPLNTDQESRLSEAAPFYRRLGDRINVQDYYYYGMPAFAGNLTKELMQDAAQAKLEGRELQNSMTPTLLSIWSGVKCPVSYTSIIDLQAIGSILEYVKVLAAMHWMRGMRGSKYFYGHCLG